MKKPKKKIIILVTLTIILLFGLIPHKNISKDGGTIEYSAVFYKVIFWHKINPDAKYDKEGYYVESEESQYLTGTSFYIFPFNFGNKEWKA